MKKLIRKIARWAFEQEWQEMWWENELRNDLYQSEMSALRNALAKLGYRLRYKNTAHEILKNDLPTPEPPEYWILEKVN